MPNIELIAKQINWKKQDDISSQLRPYLENACTEDELEILLNCPVVYVHTWENRGKKKVYVGETSNILRRTEEHLRTAQNQQSGCWQKDWENPASQNKISYFFGGSFMNKSLTMDIENYLIQKLGDSYIEGERTFNPRNGRGNPQGLFNNKDCINEVLRQICSFLGMAHTEGISFTPVSYPDGLFSYCEKFTNETDLEKNIKNKFKGNAGLLLDYPVIYLHVWENYSGKIKIYVGETNQLLKRTKQHLDNIDKDWHTDWKKAKEKFIFVFGHREFNKSMTLDIENRLIQYSICNDCSVNKRTNEQNDYDNCDKTFDIFSEIIKFMTSKFSEIIKFMTSKIFSLKSLDYIKNKAAFEASPFLELTKEQEKSKDSILNEIYQANKQPGHTVIVVHGGAGTGKTVLASSIWFSLLEQDDISSYFIVNHAELLKSYNERTKAWKLGGNNKPKNQVLTAQNFINEKYSADVTLVDEAHLLYAKNHMGSVEGDQLPKLILQSKVTVLFFDPNQFIHPDQVWNQNSNWKNMDAVFNNYLNGYYQKNNLNVNVSVKELPLKKQLRMTCSDETMKWLTALHTDGSKPLEQWLKVPKTVYYDKDWQAYFAEDENGYEIGVFEDPKKLVEFMMDKEKSEDLSRLLASYCWGKNDDIVLKGLKWHRVTKKGVVKARHDIQGFDLNYAGVILGQSLKFDNGIQIDIKKHRGLKKRNIVAAKESVSNEYHVLLTRAIKGCFLYAVDKGLRDMLTDMMKKFMNKTQQ